MTSLSELKSVPVFEIPVEKIAVIDRARKDLGNIGELAEKLKSEGQIQAGCVRQVREDDIKDYGLDPVKTPYILVAGGRRYAAACLAGLDTFKAEFLEDLPPLRQKIIELEENLGRKDYTWDELAHLRAEIHEWRKLEAAERGEKWGVQDTGEIIGNPASVSRAIKLSEALKEDPSLKSAGSERAAMRILDMRAHLKRQEEKLARTRPSDLRDVVVTAQAQDWLRKQPSSSVDLYLSDLPYGYGYHSLARKDIPKSGTYSTDYDDSEGVTLDLFADVVPEILRITKDSGWIVIFMAESNAVILRDLFETCCGTHFEYGETIYEQVEGGDWIKHMPTACTAGEPGCTFVRAEVPSWIWFRPNSINKSRFPELHAKNFYEPILVFNRGSGKLYKHQDECPNVLVYDAEYGVERVHANQKPRALARELVQRFTMPGEVVMDSFFGSGNLLAGAAEVHRRILGCDSAELMLEPALANIGNFYER